MISLDSNQLANNKERTKFKLFLTKFVPHIHNNNNNNNNMTLIMSVLRKKSAASHDQTPMKQQHQQQLIELNSSLGKQFHDLYAKAITTRRRAANATNEFIHNEDTFESLSDSLRNELNELCTRNEDDFIATNIKTTHKRLTNKTYSQGNTTSNNNNSSGIDMDFSSSVEATMIASSGLKRQSGVASLTLSSIEVPMNSKLSSTRISSTSYRLNCSEKSSFTFPLTSSTHMCSEVDSRTVCSCCDSTTTDENCQSWLDKNFLSSTPFEQARPTKKSATFKHSTLIRNNTSQIVEKHESLNRFSLFKNCVLSNKKKLNKQRNQIVSKYEKIIKKKPTAKAAEPKQYKFNNIASISGISAVNNNNNNNKKRLRVKQEPLVSDYKPKRRFPRTSSFNSNDEVDLDLEEFNSMHSKEASAKVSNQFVESSFMPPNCNQNFNNFGDFLVWYV